MLTSERIREPAKRIGGAIRSCRVQWFEERADEVAKYERAARAARDVSNDHCLLVHESCLLFDGTNDSCPACRLLAALDRKSTRLNSSHKDTSRMPSSA